MIGTLLPVQRERSEIVDRIQSALNDRGWTESELARRLTPQEHRNWVIERLNGNTKIKADELLRIADALEVSGSFLLEGEAALRPTAVPARFRDAFERGAQRRRDEEAAVGPWAGGVQRGIIERDDVIFDDMLHERINRVRDPNLRKVALRLVGALDLILGTDEQPA